LISTGTIALSMRDSTGSTFDLLQDHLTHAYTGVKFENLGLCDSKCWYEAIEDQRQAVTLPRGELIPLLKQEYIMEILLGIIDAIQREKEDREDETENHEGAKIDPFLSVRHWKQDFISRLKIPIEFKKMLGYEEE
jgi:hypothetical protein